MSRFPKLTPQETEQVQRCVALARQTDREEYSRDELIDRAEEFGIRPPDPMRSLAMVQALESRGYIHTVGGNALSIRPTPLANDYVDYLALSSRRQCLSNLWYALNIDKPVWVRSVYGFLGFVVAAAATGAGFVIGLWLARLAGLPIS